MPILITDDFVGPAGVLSGTTTDQGDNWSADLTDLVLTGEGGLAVDAAAMSFTRWGTIENPTARDMRVQISFSRYTLTNVAAMVGVLARNTAGNTTDFIDASVVFGGGACKVYLQATGASQAPFVQYTRLAGDLDASNHTLALEVEGSAIRVYLDGLLVINATATTVPAASPWFCGVLMNNDAIGGTPRIDSFSATQIVPVVSALRKTVFDTTLLRQGWFAATRRPKGWFTNELMDEAAATSNATGAPVNITSATTLATLSATQAQRGTTAAASTATSTSAPAATQGQAGVIAPATTATSASTPAGTQGQKGAIAPASSATSMSTAAATEVHAGVIAPASTATSSTGPAGSQGQVGAISPATSSTSSTGPAASQAQQGAIAGATSATSVSTVAGDAGNAATPGVIAPASTATTLATPAGTQEQAGAIAGATSSTSMGTVAGTQAQVGAPAPATSATQLSTIAVGDAPAPPPAPPDTGSGGGGGSPHSGRIPFHLRVNMLGRKPDVPLHVASEDWEGEMFALAQALITSGVLEECP